MYQNDITSYYKKTQWFPFPFLARMISQIKKKYIIYLLLLLCECSKGNLQRSTVIGFQFSESTERAISIILLFRVKKLMATLSCIITARYIESIMNFQDSRCWGYSPTYRRSCKKWIIFQRTIIVAYPSIKNVYSVLSQNLYQWLFPFIKRLNTTGNWEAVRI